jgi:ubiquitin thioesterase OTU1
MKKGNYWWISRLDSWGGGIELAILSSFYEIEICAFDVKSCRMDCFGQDKSYKTRVYLLYNGIHYDALALSEQNAPEEMDITLFSPDDKTTELKALKCVKGANERHEYTDVSDFKLVCLQCYTKLIGQKEALEHANKTKHNQFAENK